MNFVELPTLPISIEFNLNYSWNTFHPERLFLHAITTKNKKKIAHSFRRNLFDNSIIHKHFFFCVNQSKQSNSQLNSYQKKNDQVLSGRLVLVIVGSATTITNAYLND